MSFRPEEPSQRETPEGREKEAPRLPRMEAEDGGEQPWPAALSEPEAAADSKPARVPPADDENRSVVEAHPLDAPPEPSPAARPLEIGDDDAREEDDDEVLRIRYMESFRYVFHSGNWALNLLVGAGCVGTQLFVPILGYLLFSGYLYEVSEALFRRPGGKAPDFDFGRFTQYLGRAVWPLMIYMVFGGAFAVLGILMLAGGILLVNWQFNSNEPIVGVAVAAIFTALLVVLAAASLGLMMAATPVLLRAGLAQEFRGALRPSWVFDFVRRTWAELLLVSIFSLATMLTLSLAGSLIACLGALAGIALALMAQSHLQYQLYEIYLSRGGTPIPLKPIEYDTPW